MQKLTREEKIILEIQNNPGIRFRELMKMVGITNGILSYYITKLEKIGTVHVQRKSGVSRFFMPDLTDDELKLTKYLRMPTPKKILVVLLEDQRTLHSNKLLKKLEWLQQLLHFISSS